MSTGIATTGLAEVSPRNMARMTGALFLLTIVAGVVAEAFISQRLVVPGDAEATATNILANESLYLAGFTIYLVEMAAQVAMTVSFYYLLKPVSRSLALLAAAFGLVGCTIKTLSRLFYVAPLVVLDNATYLAAFEPDQLEAMALVLLGLNDRAAGMALVFFGLTGLVNGYLVFQSTFLPRFLGVLKLAGGLGWLTFISPPIGMQLFPIIAGVGVIGALVTIGWLLIVGVDEPRWRARASLAAASIWA
jgi:hypothetical protein